MIGNLPLFMIVMRTCMWMIQLFIIPQVLLMFSILSFKLIWIVSISGCFPIVFSKMCGDVDNLPTRYSCFSFHRTILPVVDVVRYLGIYIDKHLIWRHEVKHIVKISRRKIFAISRLSIYRSLFLLYSKSFVLPCIEYCCTVWIPYI